jgi:predicted ATPase/class 3 adenylate cyclase
MAEPSGTVTFLFTDIEGSTRLWEQHPEVMDRALQRHDELMRSAIESAQGYVFKTVGDAFCAAFASARDAVEAAGAAQQALQTESWPEQTPLRVRMALHTGECQERDGDYFGPAVNRTARLEATAHGDQVVMSQATAALVRDSLRLGMELVDLGSHRLKDLGHPEQIFGLRLDGLKADFPHLRSLDNPELRHNLPSQTSTFVGRVAELGELRSLVLGGSRLVTIVGPGGIGKSRLALQVAAEALDGNGEGVWLVELAPVVDPELVATTLAAVLQVREEPGRPLLDTLVDAVGDRYLLVVLDNAEHVLDTTAKLADALLRSCPRAVLLVTSREALGVSGEQVYRVPPLAVPPAEIFTADQLATFESVQLFVERASLQRRTFLLDEVNASAVASVCARLDGIPLALELAAARLGSLSVSEIDDRLDERFRLLTGGSRAALPRHKTLRALIDWSYELLNPDEQALADRLSVFAGGWTLDAAEAVTAGGATGGWQVLDHLAALVDKSLVQADETQGSTRYRLLETVRHYTSERLGLCGGSELRATRTAHRDHYLALVETAAEHLHGGDQAVWLDRLEVDIENIRAALSFCIADVDSTEPGLRLAAGLRWFCPKRGHGREVLDALGALLARPDAHGPTLTRARALNARCNLLDRFGDDSPLASSAEEAISIARGHNDDALTADGLCQLSWINYERDDLPTALAQSDEAIGLARTVGDRHLMADILTCRAVLETARYDWSAAFAALEEVLLLCRATDDNFGLASTLLNIGAVKLALGELRTARAHLEEANTLAGDLGYQSLLAAVLENLGLVDIIDGDPRQARYHFIDSLEVARLTGVKSLVPGALLGLALAASASGEHTAAVTLHGVADEHYERAGQPFEVLEEGLRERDHSHLHAMLSDAAFEKAYRHGRTLHQADAIALATAAGASEVSVVASGTDPAGGRVAADGSTGVLSARGRRSSR